MLDLYVENTDNPILINVLVQSNEVENRYRCLSKAFFSCCNFI